MTHALPCCTRRPVLCAETVSSRDCLASRVKGVGGRRKYLLEMKLCAGSAARYLAEWSRLNNENKCVAGVVTKMRLPLLAPAALTKGPCARRYCCSNASQIFVISWLSYW